MTELLATNYRESLFGGAQKRTQQWSKAGVKGHEITESGPRNAKISKHEEPLKGSGILPFARRPKRRGKKLWEDDAQGLRGGGGEGGGPRGGGGTRRKFSKQTTFQRFNHLMYLEYTGSRVTKHFKPPIL